MTIAAIKEALAQTESYKSLQEALANKSYTHLKGWVGSARAMLFSCIAEQNNQTNLIILSNKEEAAYFFNDIESCADELYTPLFFPASYRTPYQLENTDNANVLLRAETLNKLSHKGKKPSVVVTYPKALSEKVVTKKHLSKNTLEIKVNETYSIDFIRDLLISYDFHLVDYVYEPGQFSVRGGIVDVFSFSNEHPYRIEFFGDDVDSIRKFDPINQLSVQKMNRISIVPNVQEKLMEESHETFLEFLPEGSRVWVSSVNGTLDELEKQFEVAQRAYDKLESEVKRMEPAEVFMRSRDFADQINNFGVVEWNTTPYKTPDFVVTFNQRPQPAFNKNFEILSSTLKKQEQAGFENLITSNNPKQIERLYAIFEDGGFETKFTPVNTDIAEGFIDNEAKLACFTDHQIFERFHRFNLKEGFKQNKQALTLKELSELQPGDYVTHIDHGVGKFSGLQKIDVNGKQQETIRLVYKDNDILYVSIHSLHRISKFTGKEGTEPKMNKLGTQAWNNLKNKTKKKVKEIAFDLIKLYAQRKAAKGFTFSPDTYLQTELEASFMYEDTPDQLAATIDVKADMENEAPMDRLICGDVGFGKTEIAIRAAFKAVADSKQVAILVPTTVLSMQHYKSIKKRLADFPCKVDYVNRFKTGKKMTETLKQLASGEIDILVGTHKLISKTVKFKDLGLLIIDEEQKFGVAVKDKLKLLKANLDTLTLTATPIPRTLQFSLMKARDLSIINTPPPNRYPVQTEIHGFNEEIIRDAISYELSRNGQVYFIHNRVQNIKEVAGLIQRLVPDARVITGHGQMDGEKLEAVMTDFTEGLYDVLVATTIIESGIDIANANTIIINHAENFGLSDLHQLRGRVGRTNKKAFCYLLAPPLHTLSNESRQRLTAIEQFSDLGSGMNIAMRDLDIRGAGNLLGGEQSGFISDIGFETYQKILNEAIQELKQEEFKELFEAEEKEMIAKQHFVDDCILETDLHLLIPDDYITSIAERLNIYRELDGLDSQEEIEQFSQRLIDRFGPIPEETEELLHTITLRRLAKQIGFTKLILKQEKLIGHFIDSQESPYYQSPVFSKVLLYVQKNPQGCKMYEKQDKLRLSFSNVKTVKQALNILTALAG